MSSTTSSSNLTSGFIDLATFDELEKYMYGGDDATSYFVRKVKKATWYTVVPVVLSKGNGIAQFNQQWSASISRAGDYLLRAFLRVTIPAIQSQSTSIRLRWTKNLMHNLIRECTITFNDLVEMRFDNYFLDFWAQFSIPGGKQSIYDQMIGNVPELTDPVGVSGTSTAGSPPNTLPQMTLNLPLPICHSRDSGVALPTAALPYNDMRLNFNFRDYTDLIVADVAGKSDAPASIPFTRAVTSADFATPPQLIDCNVWAEYAIVSNVERRQMGQAPRDILIEQVQTAPVQSFDPTRSTSSFDIRLSHAIKTLYFGARNKTIQGEGSNYTTASPVPPTTATGVYATGTPSTQITGETDNTPDAPKSSFYVDPISTVSLFYESSQRLSNMGVDYFSLVQPWYTAVCGPRETGYHMYSYSLDIMSVNPMGSTNYGKLTNVSIQVTPSSVATSSGATRVSTNGTTYATTGQTYEFVLVAVNHNIVRVSGGALGFPVL